MLEYIKSHPDYALILILNILVVFKVLMYIKNTNEDGNDDDEGGSMPESPKLDLPPGVTLPISREKEKVI